MPRWSVLALVAACSDAPAHVDATLGDAYDSARCLVAGDYGTITSQIIVTSGQTAMFERTLTGALDAGAPPDELFIKFAQQVMPGTYIVGYPCYDVCIELRADVAANGAPAKRYAVTSGMLTWGTVSVAISGNAKDLAFVELDETGQLLSDGCRASIRSVAFGTQ